MYINAIWLDSEQQIAAVSKSYSASITEKTHNFGSIYHTDSPSESRKSYRKHYAKSQNLSTRSSCIKLVASTWVLETLDHKFHRELLSEQRSLIVIAIAYLKNPSSFWRAFFPSPVYLFYQCKGWPVTRFNNKSATSDSPVSVPESTWKDPSHTPNMLEINNC